MRNYQAETRMAFTRTDQGRDQGGDDGGLCGRPEIGRAPHHQTTAQALAERMKDPEDELKLVIVRDMWLTGFDALYAHPVHRQTDEGPQSDAGHRAGQSGLW
jgi:hypothetical protein